MTPKEKAQDLFDKIYFQLDIHSEEAKKWSLITVDELIFNSVNNYIEKYWQEVKNEIERL